MVAQTWAFYIRISLLCIVIIIVPLGSYAKANSGTTQSEAGSPVTSTASPTPSEGLPPSQSVVITAAYSDGAIITSDPTLPSAGEGILQLFATEQGGLSKLDRTIDGECGEPTSPTLQTQFLFAPILAAVLSQAASAVVGAALGAIDQQLATNLKQYLALYNTPSVSLPMFDALSGKPTIPNLDQSALQCIRIVRFAKGEPPNFDLLLQVEMVQGQGFVFVPRRFYFKESIANPDSGLKVQVSVQADSTWIDHGIGKSSAVFSGTTVFQSVPFLKTKSSLNLGSGLCSLSGVSLIKDKNGDDYKFETIASTVGLVSQDVAAIWYYARPEEWSVKSASTSTCPAFVNLATGHYIGSPPEQNAPYNSNVVLPIPPISSDFSGSAIPVSRPTSFKSIFAISSNAQAHFFGMMQLDFTISETGTAPAFEAWLKSWLDKNSSQLSSSAASGVKSALGNAKGS